MTCVEDDRNRRTLGGMAKFYERPSHIGTRAIDQPCHFEIKPLQGAGEIIRVLWGSESAGTR